jgi:two-component system, cell cycle sensor histidine kinase and response regulator CckA
MSFQKNAFPRWRRYLVGLIVPALVLVGTVFLQKASGQDQLDQSPSSIQAQNSNVTLPSLTEEEKAWLDKHPAISVAQDPGWAPVEFADENGQPTGISNDYLKLVERRLGITFQRVSSKTWQDSYTRLKKWDIDMTTCVAKTQERAEFWAFTRPYMKIPIVILTQLDVAYIGSMHELEGKRVAVVDGYVTNEWIQRDYPNIQLVKVNSVKEGLAMLQRGQVFSFIDNMLVIDYYKAHLKPVNLKIAGATPYVNAQRMAVRKDWAILAGMIQKALDSISERERAQIYQKWVPVRYQQTFNYKLLWQALTIFVLVLAALLFWNRKLSREIKSREQAEAALRETEQRYRGIIETAMDGFWMVDTNGRILEANDAYCKMSGYDREELLGMNVADLEAVEAQQEIAEHIRRIFAQGSDCFETVHRRKDGRAVHVEVAAKFLPGDGGRLFTFMRNITEAKGAEKALRDSEQRYRELVQNANSAIIRWKVDGTIAFLNEYAQEVFGYSPEEAVGRPVGMLVPEKESTGRDLRTLIRDITEHPERYVSNVNENVCRDGSRIWIAWTNKTILDDDGQVAEILAVGSDITSLKRAEEDLKNAEERYRSVFENAAIGIDLVDAEGRFVQVNQTLANMFGYSADELLNMTIDDLTHPEDLEASRKRYEKIVQGDEDSSQFEKRYIRKDGKEIWADVTVSCVRGPGGAHIATIGVIADITGRKRAEEALLASESFLNSVIDQSPYPMWISDRQGTLVRMNKALADLLKISDDEIVGKYNVLKDNIVEAQGFLPLVRSVFEEGNSVRFEIQYDTSQLKGIQLKQAAFAILDLTIFPVKDLDGKVTNAVCQHMDITERERTEEAFAEATRRLQLAVVASNIGLWDWNLESNKIFFSREWKSQIGYADHELPDEFNEWQSRLHPDDIDQAIKRVHDYLENPWPEFVNEFRLRHKDGSYRWIRAQASLLRDEDGKPVRMLGCHLDITDQKKLEHSIRESADRYRSLFENMREGYAYCRMIFEDGEPVDFVYLSVNEAFEKLTGLDNVVGKKVTEAIPGIRETNPELFEIYDRVAETGEAERFETYVHPLGVWLSVSVYSVESEHFIAVFDNITDRKRAEKALKDSEERYRHLVEVSPDGIAVHQEGRIVFVNPAAADMLGARNSEDLIGMRIREIVHPDYWEHAEKRVRLMMAGETGLYPVEDCYVKFDGTALFVEVMASIFEYSGKPAIQLVVRDISERKRAESTERRLLAAIGQATEGVIVTDTEGTIEYVNPGMERMTGYGRDELIGRTPRIFKSGEHDRAFYRQLWDTIKAGNTWTGRFINRRKDGRLFYEDATISPVKDAQGKIMNFVGVKRDITEHLELSRQLYQAQKMEAVGTLAGGVAHDFNNILQVAIGYSELMLGDEVLPPRCRTDLKKVHEAALRGADLVQRLLTFSRKTEMKPQPLNLNRRITELQKMLERTLPKMVEIRLQLADELATIDADPTQIDQILMNLAVNARDAMPDGGSLIFETANVILDREYARIHFGARPGSHVLLTVTDTGSGMDKGTLDHIFEPFYTTKGVGEGTGLGLAMVHGIVRHHGGHITCYSEKGHGTSFKIYFPAMISEEEPDDKTKQVMPRGGNETILVVDDEEHVRDLCSRILTRAGYKVITATNGKEALTVYEQRGHEVNLVILDLIMPQMGGRQCLEELLILDPSAKVVIASGYSSNGPTEDALAGGGKGFIGKPYNMRQVLGVIRKVLDDK